MTEGKCLVFERDHLTRLGELVSAVNGQIQSNQGGTAVRLHMWLDQNRNN